MATTTEKWVLGSVAVVVTTGAALTNNSLVAGAVFDNTQGQAGDGYSLCDLELSVQYTTAPTANTGVSLWFLQSQDGTNYEYGAAGTTPARSPDVVFPVAATTVAELLIRRAWLPWGKQTPLIKNDGTGQTMPLNWYVKLRPVGRQSV